MKIGSLNPATRIVVVAVGMLAVTSLLVGAAVLGVMQYRLEDAISISLGTTLENRSQLFVSLISLREGQMRFISSRPRLKQSARAVAAGTDVPRESAAIETVLKSFLETGYTGLVYYDAQGGEVARAGRFVEAPALSVQLRSPLQSELLWTDRFVLRARIPMSDAEGVLGTVVAEQPLPVTTQLMELSANMGETGELALCFAKGDAMGCFPQRLNPRPAELPRVSAAGTPLPMARALEGRKGFERASDYRGKEVLAAYGPVGDLGLGMVAKMDKAELLAPVREQLLTIFLVCGLVVAGGALLMRAQMRPMALQLVRAEEDARQTSDRLQFISDNVPALVAYLDTDERYRFANRTYEDWFGIVPGDMTGRSIGEVWGAERDADTKRYVDRVLRGERVVFEAVVKAPGGERTLHSAYVPDHGPDGKVRGFFILASDISQIAEARKALAKTKQRLDLALDASRVTVWETDARTGETVLSEAWAEMLDRPPGETHTTVAELAALVHPTEEAEIRRLQMAAMKGATGSYSVEHRVRAAGGHWKWVLSRGKVVERDPATGRALRMMGTNVDITARKAAEQRMEQLASYDTLTGVANRSLFGDRVARAIVRNRRSGLRSALLYLDIDKFKGVNDNLGHATGDALLREFAARLQRSVRASDTVGRLGGDEFAVLLEDVTEPGTAARIAEKILEAVRAPVNAEGHSLVVTTSVGVVEFGAGGADGAEDAETLAKRGDVALYEAKAAGRDTYRLAA